MKYIIIGNSAAAIGAAEGIRQIDKMGEITIISNEPHHTYSRPLISYLLLGKVTEETMKYRPGSFYKDTGCTFIHANVTKIDPEAKTVSMETNGQGPDSLPYDKLLAATGSSPFVPPFEGLGAVTEKYTFMSLDDAKALDVALTEKLSGDNHESKTATAIPDKKVLIVGAGLIGLKCAEGILDKASSITVIDLAPRILSSILDDDGADIVQKHLENKGIKFILSSSVKRFCKNNLPQAGYTAVTDSGAEIAFDILVLAVGVRPNTSLLEGIAEIDRGIIVNSKSQVILCKTSAASGDIYAAGDCTQTTDISSGQSKVMALLPNAFMQGECAGVNMAGGEKDFDKAIPMNAIGFCGLHCITAGNYTGDEYSSKDSANSNYKRLFYSGNKLNGYIMVGDIDKAGIYTSLIRECTPLDTIDFGLICEKPGLMAFTKEDRTAKLG